MKPFLVFDKKADKIWTDFIKGKLKSGNGVVFFAEEKGTVAGMCFGYIMKNVDVFKVKKLGFVGEFYVKKQFQKKGIASRLRNELFAWFRKKGITEVSLHVFVGNTKPLSIYKKWGFSELWQEMRKKI